jgi:hypothetical protein
VLDRKLSGAASNNLKVCPIKEEEEDEERRVGCVVSINDCAKEEESSHELCYQSMDVTNSCEVEMDLSGCTILRDEHKSCQHCQRSIDNCYSVCKTCLREGTTYCLCDACSDSHCFSHPISHVFDTIIDYDVLKDNKL